MTTSVVRTRLAATASILALSIAAPALAQTAPVQTAPEGATAIDDIIVTAQKREESIQDVPIAVSAFSAEMLDAMKIEGGSELMRAIPNVSFSKNNFSMYNFSIRGIGTKAVSASSDPAVAVSFNNSPLIRNRLFEQEYLDVNRVEVLRGPQGTLYGRNATAGVINMIPNLPGPDFDAMLRAEVGNYGSRRGQMMVNIPLTDTFWVRGAASMTQRDGFDYNSFNDTHVNGRDLFSTRLSAAWEPTANFRASLIWEHFEEDDDRSRTGKQLCTRDPGPTSIAGSPVPAGLTQNRLSQGCLPGSLYSDQAYGTPNGGSFPHVYLTGLVYLGLEAADTWAGLNKPVYAINNRVDPYAGVTQSRNLREISTSYDPRFQAENDVFQLNLEYVTSSNLKITSQTTYAEDRYYSTQDYNRFVSNPIFVDSEMPLGIRPGEVFPSGPSSPGGVYTDPQLGASSRMVSADLSKSDNRQFTQEFRVQSDWDGPFNFNIGANYINFKTQDNYYVFNNLFSYIAEYWYNQNIANFSNSGLSTIPCDEAAPAFRECVYVDYNDIENLDDNGHNYFLSKNNVSVESTGIFAEGYFDVTDNISITTGIRYTNDNKITTPYPSQLLLGATPAGVPGILSGGYVNKGYPALPDVNQSWEAFTGRLVVDWSPDISISDSTLIYASYSRGYKGGGTNPPRVDINPEVIQYLPLDSEFEPEYVNALEIGTKNTFFDGRMRLNATAFYYDYKDYQVSQIVDRISLNENFDARVWGLEIETVLRPTRAWQIDANIGYQRSRIANGEKSIDVMNRTQGDPEWTLLRPWVQVPSNCIAPTRLVKMMLDLNAGDTTMNGLQALCAGSARYGSFTPDFPSSLPFWAFLGVEYNPLKDAPNYGRGFFADLGGNSLPNAPELTFNIGTQYNIEMSSWDVMIRADYYRQSDSYFRIYNTEYDVIKSWDNVNLSISATSSDGRIQISAYVKNLMDNAPITDAFTNSDDTGLTTNVFTLDPRMIGFNVKRTF